MPARSAALATSPIPAPPRMRGLRWATLAVNLSRICCLVMAAMLFICLSLRSGCGVECVADSDEVFDVNCCPANEETVDARHQGEVGCVVGGDASAVQHGNTQPLCGAVEFGQRRLHGGVHFGYLVRRGRNSIDPYRPGGL